MIWWTLAVAGVADVKTGLKSLEGRAWGDAATALSRGLDSTLSDKWRAKALFARAQARTHIAMDAAYNDDQARAALADFRGAKALGMKITDAQEVEDLSTMLLHQASKVESPGERRIYADGAAFLTPSVDTLFAVCLHAQGLDDIVTTCSAVLDWPDADPTLHKRPAAAARIARSQIEAKAVEPALSAIQRGQGALEAEQTRSTGKDASRSLEQARELASLKAKILGVAGRNEELLSAIDAVLAFDDTHLGALFVRARALEDLERFDEAETAYRRILELSPERQQAHYALGAMFTNQAIPLQKSAPEKVVPLFEKARPHLERAAELAPEPALLEVLVQVLDVLGDDAARDKWAGVLHTEE